jgi:hypothetical protein
MISLSEITHEPEAGQFRQGQLARITGEGLAVV